MITGRRSTARVGKSRRRERGEKKVKLMMMPDVAERVKGEREGERGMKG